MIDTALCLPAPDIEALLQGRIVVALFKQYIDPGEFVLYPSAVSPSLLPIEQYYRSNFLPIARNAVVHLTSETPQVKAWASCEFCQILDGSESCEALSRLTIWQPETFQKIFAQQPYIFLAYLRVYKFAQAIEVSAIVDPENLFVALLSPLSIEGTQPVLSKTMFQKRCQQLQAQQPPFHPELEELQSAIAQFNDSSAPLLANRISHFLGWKSETPNKLVDPQKAWIKNIVIFGNRSDEKDANKSNYQAGTDFERVVHKSLEFLGFGVDPNAKGGAGGMDLYCTTPYSLVGECKAGKNIPDSTAEQLYRIGTRHLGKEDYESAVKLIIGPGKPTKFLQESAQKSTISIIKPMTLQKLVELEAKFPGSVNLIELKPYLEAGQIDARIDEYIEKVLTEIKLRSHVVQVVKNYLEKTGLDNAEVGSLHGTYIGSNHSPSLTPKELHEILIELSSPLAGYLGRKKVNNESRFYFLRDLHIDSLLTQ
ncbi:MAG: DUF1802 family protein [Kamptonema sp. SIO1D9]|nr:DUF1802 family protein [Kamptonema sp. SIO1D9]